jgi:hypothetical protein
MESLRRMKIVADAAVEEVFLGGKVMGLNGRLRMRLSSELAPRR